MRLKAAALLLVAFFGAQYVRCSPAEERGKLFSRKQMSELEGILDDAAQGELANNLTVIELALQKFLLTKTQPGEDSRETVAVSLNGKDVLSKGEVATLHQKLEKVGDMLRGSLDHYRTEREKEASPFVGVGAKFHSGEHERMEQRNRDTMATDPRPLTLTNGAQRTSFGSPLALLAVVFTAFAKGRLSC